VLARPRACGSIRLTMTAWIAVLIPLLIMVFALGMERLETRLRAGTVREDEVEDFLERARPDEVKALFRQGIGGALQLFRLRNLGKRHGSRRNRGATSSPSSSRSTTSA
jgi:hypothetical protein